MYCVHDADPLKSSGRPLSASSLVTFSKEFPRIWLPDSKSPVIAFSLLCFQVVYPFYEIWLGNDADLDKSEVGILVVCARTLAAIPVL